MKSLITSFLLLFSIVVNAQYEDRILVHPKHDKNQQWIMISQNRKKLLSDEPLNTTPREIIGRYKGVLLSELVDSILARSGGISVDSVNSLISDSIATIEVDGGGLPYYELVFRYSTDGGPAIEDVNYTEVYNSFPFGWEAEALASGAIILTYLDEDVGFTFYDIIDDMYSPTACTYNLFINQSICTIGVTVQEVNQIAFTILKSSTNGDVVADATDLNIAFLQTPLQISLRWYHD